MVTISYRIDWTMAHVGESGGYSCTLDERTRLVFDSFTQTSGINGTLSGPDGTVGSSRRFDQSDGLGLGANPVLDLSAGNWTLTIDGAGDAAEAYAFRLLDMGEAEELAPAGIYNRALGQQDRKSVV